MNFVRCNKPMRHSPDYSPAARERSGRSKPVERASGTTRTAQLSQAVVADSMFALWLPPGRQATCCPPPILPPCESSSTNRPRIGRSERCVGPAGAWPSIRHEQSCQSQSSRQRSSALATLCHRRRHCSNARHEPSRCLGTVRGSPSLPKSAPPATDPPGATREMKDACRSALGDSILRCPSVKNQSAWDGVEGEWRNRWNRRLNASRAMDAASTTALAASQ